MDTATQDRVHKLLQKWNKVQAYLKSSELITEAAPVAAINELRYAGRSFVDALLMARDLPDVFDAQSETYTKDFASALAVTEQYIDNAMHDISDVMIYFYISSLNSLINRNGFKNTINKDKDLIKALDDVERAKILIIESRQDRRVRERNYAEVQEIVESLSSTFPKIQKSDLTQEIEKKNRARKSLITNISIAIGALILGYLFSSMTH